MLKFQNYKVTTLLGTSPVEMRESLDFLINISMSILNNIKEDNSDGLCCTTHKQSITSGWCTPCTLLSIAWPVTLAQGLVWVAGRTVCSSSNIEVNVVFLVSIHNWNYLETLGKSGGLLFLLSL